MVGTNCPKPAFEHPRSTFLILKSMLSTPGPELIQVQRPGSLGLSARFQQGTKRANRGLMGDPQASEMQGSAKSGLPMWASGSLASASPFRGEIN